MFFVAVNTHIHTPRKSTQPLSFVVDDKIGPQVTLGLFPPHPWPLRQVVLPVPTTLLPQRPSIECFLWPSTHLVGLATMPHNLGLAQWVKQYSGKFLSLHPLHIQASTLLALPAHPGAFSKLRLPVLLLVLHCQLGWIRKKHYQYWFVFRFHLLISSIKDILNTSDTTEYFFFQY